MTQWLTLVGIGEDGFPGLGKAARRALLRAEEIFGAPRQLELLPRCIRGTRQPWPSPFDIAPLLARRGQPVCALASGDPMWHGLGATLARRLDPAEMQVLPAPSSASLAAARLGWPLHDTPVISLLQQSSACLHRELHPGRRLLVLSRDGETPAQVAALLCAAGYGDSLLTTFEYLGGPRETRVDAPARDWVNAVAGPLNLLAIDCRATTESPRLGLVPGLPDDAFEHDGQLTKRDVRALTLARLAPAPGELLWDIGAGCGSIGIEWMRAHPSCRALAIERDADRQQVILRNRDRLGVPGLQLVSGPAPAALDGLEAPDAVFIGGGVTRPGVLEQAWATLKPGGRLIANAVTLQSEAALVAFREQVGGELTRIAIAQAQPLGGFDTWRSALPITLLHAWKPRHA